MGFCCALYSPDSARSCTEVAVADGSDAAAGLTWPSALASSSIGTDRLDLTAYKRATWRLIDDAWLVVLAYSSPVVVCCLIPCNLSVVVAVELSFAVVVVDVE